MDCFKYFSNFIFLVSNFIKNQTNNFTNIYFILPNLDEIKTMKGIHKIQKYAQICPNHLNL